MKKEFKHNDKVTITHCAWRGLKGKILCPTNAPSNTPGVVYLVQLEKEIYVEGHEEISNITVHEEYLEHQPDGLISYAELGFGEVAIIRNCGGYIGCFVFKQSNGDIMIVCGASRPGDIWSKANAQGLRFERIDQSKAAHLTRNVR